MSGYNLPPGITDADIDRGSPGYHSDYCEECDQHGSEGEEDHPCENCSTRDALEQCQMCDRFLPICQQCRLEQEAFAARKRRLRGLVKVEPTGSVFRVVVQLRDGVTLEAAVHATEAMAENHARIVQCALEREAV